MNWMNNIVKQFWSFSFILLIIGPIFFVIGYRINNGLIMNCGFFLFSSGLAVLGLSFAIDSSNKMKSIAKSNFLEICSEFTDKRIQLFQHPEALGIEGTIWKCRQYVEWASVLEEWIEQKYQDELAQRFSVLLDNTYDWKNGIPINVIVIGGNGKQKIESQIMRITNMDVNNILIMFEYFWGARQESDVLTGFKKVSDKKKSKLIKLLEKHIAKRKKNEKEDLDFIRNVRQEIQISDEMKRKPFKRITERIP